MGCQEWPAMGRLARLTSQPAQADSKFWIFEQKTDDDDRIANMVDLSTSSFWMSPLLDQQLTKIELDFQLPERESPVLDQQIPEIELDFPERVPFRKRIRKCIARLFCCWPRRHRPESSTPESLKDKNFQ